MMSLSPSVILIIIISIVVVSYVFDQLLDYINLRAQRTDIPKEVEAFYEKDKYIKSLAYHKELTHFSFLTSGFSFALSVLMLYFGGFGLVDVWLRPYITNDILLTLSFFGILTVVSDILTYSVSMVPYICD